MNDQPEPGGTEMASELPSHPEADEPAPAREPGSASSWASMLLVGIVVALVATLVILHLTGVVGPAGN
jgi:hypothetical protein